MMVMKRRDFLKRVSIAGVAVAVVGPSVIASEPRKGFTTAPGVYIKETDFSPIYIPDRRNFVDAGNNSF